MKSMHFPRPYKRKRKYTLLIAVGVCLVLVGIVAVQPSFVTRTLLFVSSPFLTVRGTLFANSESFLGGFSSRTTLVNENKLLKEDLLRAKIKSDLYDSLRRTYSGTADSASSSVDGVVGLILATPPFSPYDTLLLNIGTAAGVSVGDSVSFDTTVALGVIDTVSKNASRVRLFSSPGYEQEVRVGAHDFIVVARGLGGGVFEISVPKETIIARNDKVFLTNGELVGSIKKIVESDAEAFSVAQVVVPQNIFEIRTVLVHPKKNIE